MSGLDPAGGRNEPRYLTRDRIAVAAVLLPFRASWPDTNVALLLVVVVVAVAAIGNRVAGGVAAVWAAVWFDFFFTLPYYRFTIRSSADVMTGDRAAVDAQTVTRPAYGGVSVARR